MRLRYTRLALADLDSILDYIALRSPRGANHVHARIQAIIGLLLTHPHIGVQTDDDVIRRIATTPYPYLIFYEISGDEIIIHAVRHAARNPSDMPGAET
jgi:toxin ParE1/3/4